VVSEGAKMAPDLSSQEAYKYAGATYALFQQAFSRNSIDGRGMRLGNTVHYDRRYNNAFWNGRQMVYGDGDGRIFQRFTAAVDVIGHELTHGVTQYTAQLEYYGQSGALNESVSDCFGSMVKQHLLGQDAKQADWLIGAGLLAKEVNGKGLRNMLEPGSAYDDKYLGKDPQPADMGGYVETAQDNGGVHLNSSIPNRAFALACVQLPGKSWETVGPVWYQALVTLRNPQAKFADWAQHTLLTAGQVHGGSSPVYQAIREGWRTVKLVS